MEIGSVGLQAGAPSARNESKSVDYDSFLKLLVAQLKNQDPTNPTDGTQFLSQLASFSSVEQAIETNSKLDSLLSSSLLGQASAVINRVVTSADGSVSGIVENVSISGGKLVGNLRDGASILLSQDVTIS